MDAILICLSIPFFFILMGLELWAARRRGRSVYNLQDSLANLGSGIGAEAIEPLFLPLTVGVYTLVYDRLHVTTLPFGSAWVWTIGFLAVDLQYYWFHRVSHRVNLLWASHAVHHQSEEYNLSVALRQSWFAPLFSWPFYLPLALAGFPPRMFLVLKTLNTLYQFWIHTRLVGRLGPLEWVLNTPSHHRVHHGINPRYIDKNYAGVLIVWDKLFGTFVPEGDEPVYGVVKPLASFNPLWANVQVWFGLAGQARRTRQLLDKLRVFFAPPEWRPSDLGGPVVVPEPAGHVKFSVPSTAGRDRRLLLEFFAVTAAITYFLYAEPHLSAVATCALGLGILAVVSSWGARRKV
jgi:sterol desaturase/sphingolipid hydroxylase (fatty acid hydroxylase superfamily)